MPDALPGDVLELLARVGHSTMAQVPEAWVGYPTELVFACTMDLDPAMREAFLEAFGEPWQMLLVAHDRHPMLAEICSWVQGRDHTLLLASPSGPPEPAVAVFHRSGRCPNCDLGNHSGSNGTPGCLGDPCGCSCRAGS